MLRDQSDHLCVAILPHLSALCSGAAGFIGSHVVHHCVRDLNMMVIAVDDLSGGSMANLQEFMQPTQHERFQFVRGDLKNETFVSELFSLYGPFEFVYHIAAYAAEGLSHFIRAYNYRNNLLSSIHLLNNCILQHPHRCRTFVFTSSIAVYGASQIPFQESTVPRPEDPYGRIETTRQTVNRSSILLANSCFCLYVFRHIQICL